MPKIQNPEQRRKSPRTRQQIEALAKGDVLSARISPFNDERDIVVFHRTDKAIEFLDPRDINIYSYSIHCEDIEVRKSTISFSLANSATTLYHEQFDPGYKARKEAIENGVKRS